MSLRGEDHTHGERDFLSVAGCTVFLAEAVSHYMGRSNKLSFRSLDLRLDVWTLLDAAGTRMKGSAAQVECLCCWLT